MSAAWTLHGGGLEAARRHFGGDDWLDLSTGINPNPWPGAAALDIDWHRLPEPEALARLEAAAAAHFVVDARNVCAVPGSELALRLVGSLIGGPARHLTPGYRTHAEMFVAGAPVARDALAGYSGTLILANPTNPDGRATPRAELIDLLGSRAADAWLLLDEAFADAVPAASLAGHIAERRRLAIFRSFGKFFGLAGVRLGFVLGPSSLLGPLRAQLGAWPVSAAAIAFGTAAYADTRWIAATRNRLRNRAAELDGVLARAGYSPSGACPLFRLIETDDAAALFERLARRAILTRPFAERPRWLRIGLPIDAAALARLEAGLADG